MSDVFSDLVRTLPEDPGEDLSTAVWLALKDMLRAELRRRDLWEASPAFLGVVGWETWYVPGDGGAHRDALDELVAECFCFNFVDRVRSLRAQLSVKPNIGGVVRLNIRHFIYERQKYFDPIGFRVFGVARDGVAAAVGRGVVRMERAAKNIVNGTVLTFVATAEPLASSETLTEIARGWNDALLPGLMTAKGKERKIVVQTVAANVGDMPRHGVRRFRFKDLLDPLKADVRTRWAEQLAQAPESALVVGEIGADRAVRTFEDPDTSLEARQSFEWLAVDVAHRIDRLEGDLRKRRYLARLWGFLAPTSWDDRDAPPEFLAMERAPSHRFLAQRLRIPRERLPDLMGTLADMVCRARGESLPGLASTRVPAAQFSTVAR